jgi:molybdate transport system substrate-binding protein
MARSLKFGIVMAVAWGLVLSLGTTERTHAGDLTIGAAYSLKPAFHEILPMFEREQGAKVQVLYGPSQTLRQQVEGGAPIDVFLPAAANEVKKLERKGLTLYGGPRVYAQTSLVLVTSKTSRATPISFGDVAADRGTRMALGDPRTTALGEITARSLTKLNSSYKSRFHVLYAEHSEHIMNLIQMGEADVGIVYRVDAVNSGQVRIIDENPAGSYVPVPFGLAIVSTCREASMDTAERFFDFMTSPRIQKLLLKYGFDAAPSIGMRAGN